MDPTTLPENGSVDRFMQRWHRFVGYTQLLFAGIGALVMAFFSVVSPSGRLVAVPGTVACTLLAAWRFRKLRGERAKTVASLPGKMEAQDASASPPNHRMEHTRDT